MRLYSSPATPFGRKAVVTLHECDWTTRVEVVMATGSALDVGTMPVDSNPLGKIPVLMLEDGRALYDSRVICRWLAIQARPDLCPTGDTGWDCMTLEATADGIMDAGILMVYETRLRPEELRFAPWVEGQWKKICRALDSLETRWAVHLAGPLDLGQIAVACALGHLDLRHASRNWSTGRPNLAAWWQQMSQRPSMQATLPRG